jgi:hypothetical protein
MGQCWLTVNLTRGRYAYGSASKLWELASDSRPGVGYPARLVTALRPGGLWSGHRVLLTGDYDDDRHGRVAAYLAAHGLAKAANEAEEQARCVAAGLSYDYEYNLYSLLSDGPLSGTDDKHALGWWDEPHEQLLAFGLTGLTGGNANAGDNNREVASAGARAATASGGAAAAPTLPEVAVSHDAAQRLTLRSHLAHVALLCLLAESSGGGGGDIDASFRGDWAGHRLEVLPADAAAALGYKDLTDAAVEEVRYTDL